jgi:hypothetical protein
MQETAGRKNWSRRQWLKGALGVAGAAALGGLDGLSGLGPGRAHGIGPRSLVSMAQLVYEGGLWRPREQAVSKLMLEVEKRTSIAVDVKERPLTATDPELFYHALLLWTGDRGFPPLPEAATQRLGVYLRAGGMLFIDDCEGGTGGEFDRSVRRDLARALPELKLGVVDWGHVFFKAFYLLDQRRPWGRVDVSRDVEGVAMADRLAVIYSRNDLQGAWARDDFGRYLYPDVVPEGERQREYSFRYGINLVMYALCINYKADQVHIPFILKRRDWMSP